jgi:cytochrome oxidase Cu insertion factor (SCO1/SenC/PrrC family)
LTPPYAATIMRQSEIGGMLFQVAWRRIGRSRRGRGVLALVCLFGGIALGSGLSLATHRTAAASPVVLRPGPLVAAKLTKQAAPGFTLVDQDGNTVSLASAKGHVTLVTFMDPVCVNLCPILGRDISAVEQKLPKGLDPELLVISSTPGRTQADVNHFLATNLSGAPWLPGWHWLIGPNQASLALAWAQWNVLENPPNDILGIVDANGYLRVSFPAPLPVSDVVSAITTVAHT